MAEQTWVSFSTIQSSSLVIFCSDGSPLGLIPPSAQARILPFPDWCGGDTSRHDGARNEVGGPVPRPLTPARTKIV